MELVFNKIENEWVAEFEAIGDFNLHLERKSTGSLVVSQRGTASGEYSAAFAKGIYEGQKVIDYDFGALVYPKWIKVESSSEVVSASINFNVGGGSGSGSGEASSWAFYKFPNTAENEMKLGILGMLSHVFSYTSETGKYVCAPSGAITQISTSKNTINAIGVDCKSLIRMNTGEVLTMDEYATLISNGSLNNVKAVLESSGLTEITKEQFYNLEEV